MPNQPEDLRSFIAMVRSRDYVILDTETTGLRRPASIWELSIISDNGEILFDRRIRPINCPDHPSFHNPEMTRADLATCPTWAEVRPTVEALLKDRDIVVYNATFDRSMFHCSDEDNNLAQFSWSTHGRWWCAMKAFSEFYGEWDSYHGNYAWKKLVDAVRICGVKPEVAHRAFADCLMTMRVVSHMLRECEDLELDDIADNFGSFGTANATDMF